MRTFEDGLKGRPRAMVLLWVELGVGVLMCWTISLVSPCSNAFQAQ